MRSEAPPEATPVDGGGESAPAPADRFQVLSIDGGGLKGIFAAAVLAAFEEALGHPLLDHFDLITGTSTGGIIALGLGAGLSPRELVEFYVDEGPKIFRGATSWRTGARHVVRSKYDNVELERALRGVFGERQLGDSCKRLVIPSFNLDAGEVYIFKTAHHGDLRRDYQVPMWQVAMATSAAPTYLPSFVLPQGRVHLVDGGVWANNPVVVGITESTSMLGTPLERVRVLSLGTSSEVSHRKERLERGGVLQWARGSAVLDVLLRGQSAGAHGMAQHLVGKEDVLRIDPVVPVKLLKLDSANTDRLISLAESNSRNESPQFINRFADHTAPEFVPVYAPSGPDHV